jgi:DNA ligase-1
MVRRLLPNVPSYHYVEHCHIENEAQLLEFEDVCLKRGFEGIMMRSPVGHYKCNRGTFKEGLIYKLKRFEDAEAIVVNIYERMINNNIAGEDSFGNTKRSHHQANKTSAGMAGGFIVNYMGMDLDVAPGSFKHPELKDIWDNKEKYLGKFLKFRFMSYGMKDKPRFIRAIGWRDKIDM